MSSARPSSLEFPEKMLLDKNPNKTSVDLQDDLHRWPTPSEALKEIKAMGKISGLTAVTDLLLCLRSMISIFFLGCLGELELAGGSLAIGFANITGYFMISGLAMGMEPICGKAYAERQRQLLGLMLQRTVLFLLSASIPITFMWANMKEILLWCGQDEEISCTARAFILFSIPDLFVLSLLHPLRIYLRTLEITLPLTFCSAVSVLLHVPLNFLLVVHFKMGIAGVAIAMVWTNLNLFVLLSAYVYFSRLYEGYWITPSADCFQGWSSLLSLVLPTCVSLCLEWWWDDLLIVLCGLLASPSATVGSMGILIQITSLVYVFPSALSLGVSKRVGNELSARRPAQARMSAIIAVVCAAGLGLGLMLFNTLMRHHWGRLFTGDAEVLELTAAELPITGLSELLNYLRTTGCGVLRGSARLTIGTKINLGSFYLIGIPVAILMGFVAKVGFAGLGIGSLAAQASCALLVLYVLCRTDWAAQVEGVKELPQPLSSSSSLPISSEGLSADSSSISVVMNQKEASKNKKRANLAEILCVNHGGGDDGHIVESASSHETDHLLSTPDSVH